MYNLLAVVVSVAIGVFMSAAGVFYAGSAFTTSSGKAQAMQILSSMEQIDAAWTMWSNDGNTTTGATPANTNLTGAPYYLSSYPPAPANAQTWGGAAGTTVAAGYVIDAFGSVGSTNGGAALGLTETTNTGIVLFLDSGTGGNACLEIARSAGVVGSTVQSFSTASSIIISGTTITPASGISSKTEIDKLAGAYRYFCMPLATAGWGATLNIGGNATANGVDGGKYLVYFKHT